MSIEEIVPIIVGVIVFGGMAVIFWIIEDNPLKRKLRNKAKQKKLDKGILKSDAFIRGYRDMGMALYPYAHHSYCGDNDLQPFNKSNLEMMAKYYDSTFKPQDGRTCKGYLSGTTKEFEDYYAGGMQLLDEVDSTQARLLEEQKVIQQRTLGLEQFDRQTIETKRELDKLRNKAYGIQADHEEFDRLMNMVTPKKSLWRRKKEVA